MFSAIKHLVGKVTVEVKDGIVRVEGVPSHVITADIRRVWGTGRIEQNLFIEIEDHAFMFYEFFCLEVHYALSRMVEERKVRANRRTLAKIIEQIRVSTWLGDTTKSFPSKLHHAAASHMTLVPLEAQAGFFAAYDQTTQQRHLNGMLLAGAAGSGKTFMSLCLAEMIQSDLIIVVCPTNALTRVWEDNLVKDFKEVPSYWICNGDTPRRGDERFLVVNYEYLTKLLAFVKTLKYKKLTILLDESHNFNEVKSMRTELFIELCEVTQCENVLWLSGTPIKALAVEAIPLLRCIDKLFTKEVEAAFRKIFGVSSERATDILKNRLDGLLYKIEKKELDITPPIFKEIKVEVPGSQKYTLKNVRLAMQKFTEERTAYYAARRRDDEKTYYDCMDLYARSVEKSKKENLAYYYRCLDTVIRCGGDARFCKEEMIYCNRYEAKEIIPALPKDKRDAFREAKTIVKYVKLKIQGECLGRVVGRLRIDAHLDMADHLDYVSIVEGSEKKTVVFTSYVEVVDKLITYLPETGLKPLFVYAKTNNRLSQILDQFEKDEDTNPLVATYASLSTAVPLVMADQAVLLDAPWRDYQLQQTVSRISRLGATTQTYVFTAVLDTGEEPNISTRSFDVLKWSQEQVMAITGVRSPFELTDDLEQANLTLENYGVEAVVDTKRQPSFMTW